MTIHKKTDRRVERTRKLIQEALIPLILEKGYQKVTVQDIIDRRFYRHKYDAARMLTRFAAKARDEVELETLTIEIVKVVQETMQPENVSLWLRKTQREKNLGVRDQRS